VRVTGVVGPGFGRLMAMKSVPAFVVTAALKLAKD
jgi:hypothetical protein